ncbi:MAG: site-specific DNA-methyltransferase [Chitinophagaceae bacterium]|nr:site-specific DNA-methyltransferase [Chitinophagaceae bacterium]
MHTKIGQTFPTETNGNSSKPLLPIVAGGLNITCEDNMLLMARYPDDYFDLAIVDPPYNVGASNGSFGRGGKKSKIKENRKDLKHYSNHNKTPEIEYFNELFRVSKNQIIWGANYYPEFLKHSGWLVWDKDKKDGILSMAELAYQSIDNRVMIFKHEWEGFRKGTGSFEDGHNRVIHPNEKPVKLYKYCLKNYAKEGDKILDTHLGSGSIAIACHDYNFELTACELDPEYFEKAKQRIINHVAQQSLF